MDFKQLNQLLGNADLLLIDQILRGKFDPGIRMLDAGCGEGRNMVYFVRQDYSIYGIDQDPGAVSMARLTASSMNRSFPVENILESSIEENPFPDGFFDLTICINVLQHARDKQHFYQMLKSLVRIIKKNGLLYLIMEARPEKVKTADSLLPGNPGEEGEREKIYFTQELLEGILSVGNLEKTDKVRSHQIEDLVRQSGLWLIKK